MMKYKLITLFAVIGFLSSCVGDMDVTPGDPNAFLADDFYSTPESYREGLAGVYANLSITGTDGAGSSNIDGLDAGTSQYGRGLWNMMVLTTDEAIWSWENDPGLREMNRNTWTAENVLLRGMFGRVMTEVAFANEYLRQTTDEQLSSRNVTGELYDNIQIYRAEARFLRALAYYHMMDLFGQAPFVTEIDVVGAYQAPKYSREELFNFIESELTEIAPELAAPLTNEYGRADRAAAWMLLAKLYLNAEIYISQDMYSECLALCEQIIGAGFSLNPVYLNNFKADNDQGAARQEIIFPILSDGVFIQNYGPTTVMINGQVGNQEANGTDYGVGSGGWGGALRVTAEFSETFQNGNYDADDRNTLITEERTIVPTDILDRNSGYITEKWSNLTSDGENGSANQIVDTDFPMFRLADVYLMYAEAHLRGGGGSLSIATDYINELRARANNTNLISQGDLTLDLILDERLVELYWEAHRRQDLVRYGLYTGSSFLWSWKGNAPNGVGIPAFMKLFPVPGASLAANPNLTQNDGY